MPGVIIKCPKCGKGHMKSINLSVVGNRRLKSIIEQTGEQYTRGCSIHRPICSRCGYVGGVDGT